MSSRKISKIPHQNSKKTINYYFPNPKKVLESSSDFLAKRLRVEKNTLNKSVDKREHLPDVGNPVQNHAECNEKIQKLQNEIEELRKSNFELLNDNKSLKKLFDQLIKVNLQKDIKINNIVSDTKNSLISYGEKVFSKFEETFEQSELKTLRSISINQTSDSTFILTLIRLLYKENPNLLMFRTSSKPTETKIPITPSKKDTVTNMYIQRKIVSPWT